MVRSISYLISADSRLSGGTAAATLHYQKNSEPLKKKLNLLLDAGAEYNCYASDIVRPSSNDHVHSLIIENRHERSLSMANLVQKAEQSMTVSSKCSSSALICSRKELFGIKFI